MPDDDLDLEPLERAAAALEEALALVAAHRGAKEERALLRDGAIQRFEFGFELAWKTLRRYLKVHGLERVDGLTNRELFRLGVAHGLLESAEPWIVFLRHRNLTSHLYDDAIADRVFASAAPFLLALQRMLRAMGEAGG